MAGDDFCENTKNSQAKQPKDVEQLRNFAMGFWQVYNTQFWLNTSWPETRGTSVWSSVRKRNDAQKRGINMWYLVLLSHLHYIFGVAQPDISSHNDQQELYQCATAYVEKRDTETGKLMGDNRLWCGFLHIKVGTWSLPMYCFAKLNSSQKDSMILCV